ncbi:MAG: hypothetical protein M3271_09540, partial [Actinomycetota bacterium]|nr:hypothetical protein [Actinomycetota bacterium]
LTAYPGTSLIYASLGGYWIEDDEEVVIDASNPDEPEVVAAFDSGALVGCHDLSFHLEETAKLALCAGESATQIWDVSDPLAPAVLSEIDNPLITFHHSAVVSPDGKYLVIGDERWLGTSQGTCGAPANHPTGALWIYDIGDPRVPGLVSYFGLRRSGLTSACSAHDFAFVPGTRKLVAAWYEGGMNVVDLADPRNPLEIAHFRGDGADYWGGVLVSRPRLRQRPRRPGRARRRGTAISGRKILKKSPFAGRKVTSGLRRSHIGLYRRPPGRGGGEAPGSGTQSLWTRRL